MLKRFLALSTILIGTAIFSAESTQAANPIITDVHTADPAALVHGDTVYIYAGQDEANPGQSYVMRKWLCYSSTDMKSWKTHGSPLAVTDFSWARADAWASQVIEKDGKFYWYVAVEHNGTKPGKAIGVAVSDSPTGPFKDARGSALITADMTSRSRISWEDIDPTVFTDSDGTSYLFWGNTSCYYAKLKPNMIDLEGPILPVDVPRFTEAPWIHKHGDLYYLSYATGFPEKLAYATSPRISGPWTYRGLLAEVAGNSNTIHQAIVEFKNQWYFVYHNGALPGGESFRRSVCIDYLYHNPDGTIQRVQQTSEGLDLPPQPAKVPAYIAPVEWNRIESLSNPNYFVRHANYKGVISEYPFLPYDDTMWKIIPGLADSKGISFEALNFPNHFLRQDGNEVALGKKEETPAFQQQATFYKESGLADANWSSFRAFGGKNLYLRQWNGKLRIEAVTTAAEKRDATFRLVNDIANIPIVKETPAETSKVSWNNPLLPHRADPHVNLQPDGNYYLTATVPAYDHIEIRKAKSLGDLSTAEPVAVWSRPTSGPLSGFIWAPELHKIGGKWYIYVAASDKAAQWNIRMYVLENPSADPLTGTWSVKGQIKTNWDSFSLDATTIEHRGVRYLAWAQSAPNMAGTNIYLAKMDTPWSITGNQVLITSPTEAWERIGHNVNEGPSVLIKNKRLFMTYSASATDANYCLGMLTADENADLLDPKSWKKSLNPVLKSSSANGQFGPGHNSFTTTPDKKTDILVYHSRNYEKIAGDPLSNPDRHTRAQIIRWNPDGTPDFGDPVADGPISVNIR